jgi:hypothetical protein
VDNTRKSAKYCRMVLQRASNSDRNWSTAQLLWTVAYDM